ncbi:MAG TPA: ABC transporter ATP-binding protein, partial [Candidatus Poseidoniales archaeon]
MRGRGGGDMMSPEDINDKVAVMGRQLWRVVPYATAYPRRLTTGLLANACARAADLLPFIAIGWAVDHFTSGGGIAGFGPIADFIGTLPQPAVGYGVIIFVSFVMLAVFQGISEYSWQTLGYKIQHDLRMDATKSLIAMEASYYDLRQTGQIMSVLSSDVNQLEDVVADSSTSIIRILVTFGFAFIILLSMSWKLAAVIFGPLMFIIPLVYWFSTRVQRRYRKQRESTGGITSVLENLISGIAVVQAYNAQSWEADRVQRESGEYRDQAIGASQERNRFLPGIYAIAGVAFGLLTVAGGRLAQSGEITTGELVTFLLISTRMTMPLFIFGILVNQLQRGEAAARRVFAAVDLEPTIVDEPGAEPLAGGIQSVEFRNVTFAYPGTSQPVLSRISFKVEAGAFLGVMGHTGAGKTTILKLLMRYYTPDEGEVLINGQPVSSFTLDSVRDAIGFVSQEPFLFHGTVEDNVRYNIDTDIEGVEAAL